MARDLIDSDLALGYEFPELTSSYDERDVVLYALGVGAGRDALDPAELKLVYELDPGFTVLPTFGVIPASRAVMQLAREGRQAPGLTYGLDRLLHGEQLLELRRPLPPRATLRHRVRVQDIFDKGRHALVVLAATTSDAAGTELCRNEFTMLVRGAGGWGGPRGPAAAVNLPPERAPDHVVEEPTADNQALLYRLSGDWNPLHADPAFARAFGFPRPILQGLCTFGVVGRHVVAGCAGGDYRRFRRIKVRFADSVFPGETLRTEMWVESPTRVVLRCLVTERGRAVIANAAVELDPPAPPA